MAMITTHHLIKTSSLMIFEFKIFESEEFPITLSPILWFRGFCFLVQAGRRKNLAKSSWGELPPKMEYLVLGTSSKYFSALVVEKIFRKV